MQLGLDAPGEITTGATHRPAHLNSVTFRIGDQAPGFVAPTASQPRFALDAAAGRYVLLVFMGDPGTPEAAGTWSALRAARASGLLDDVSACAFVVAPGCPDAARRLVADMLPGLRAFLDEDGAIARLYGFGTHRPHAILLDPALRVLATDATGDPRRLLDALAAAPPPALHAGIEAPAPVLVVPRVLEPAFCRALVAHYEATGGGESGVMSELGAQTVGVFDNRMKRRRDCLIDVEELRAGLRERIVRILSPQIMKAYHFRPTRIERYMVACYSAEDGGHFRAHRDNDTRGTAHRRFAVSINLNEEYEGGELWFPEYGPRRYRPPMGCAVVFSCSLLHEVTPVTAGRRYATLPFLYDEHAARIRDANRQFLDAAPPV
jgi:predicted 2-oxoglutarate/Fe(II)-dependent dioxygenase YbiX